MLTILPEQPHPERNYVNMGSIYGTVESASVLASPLDLGVLCLKAFVLLVKYLVKTLDLMQRLVAALVGLAVGCLSAPSLLLGRQLLVALMLAPTLTLITFALDLLVASASPEDRKVTYRTPS